MSEREFQRWIIESLVIISEQVHECECKLNELLKTTGEDKRLLKTSKRLERKTKALKAALDTPPQITTNKKETKP